MKTANPVCRVCRTQLYALLSRGYHEVRIHGPQHTSHKILNRSCLRNFHKNAPVRQITKAPQPPLSRTQAELDAAVGQFMHSYGQTIPDERIPTGKSTYHGEFDSASRSKGAGSIAGNMKEAENKDCSDLGTGNNVFPSQFQEADFVRTNGDGSEAFLVNELDPGWAEAPLSAEEQAQQHARLQERLQAAKDFDELQGVEEESEEFQRTHPFTELGRYGPTPSTIFTPKDTVQNPIQRILATAANKHLIDISTKVFGEGLRDSVATLSTKEHLQQKPIALEASQSTMSPMEANAYLAVNVPGIYASATSILVEVRKRLGSRWLEGVLKRPGGPRILDAGGAGAGVLAWRDVLRAEWQRMHPDGPPAPLGTATAVVGADELASRASTMLEQTTIIPRMPDFLPSRDLPGSKNSNPAARKTYDIIIAPHSLWTLKEDYMRKLKVQNYWSLLDPNGGVLIILEKGVPRGFELVAGARQTLLNNQISSPGSEEYENDMSNDKDSRFAKKEAGMIIAPCTNHGTCPMYTIPGKMAGRREHCHFQQRFIRPPFLQNLLGVASKGKNHEDIRFSYIAVQRGQDLRQEEHIPQNEAATVAALNGFEGTGTGEETQAPPSMLSLPRLVLPPLKRHKHVIFDVCTPAGQVERWTVPASKSKQAYRDARKARWGDLWALGAKTRIVRQVRSGAPALDEVVSKGRQKKAIKQNIKRLRKTIDGKAPRDEEETKGVRIEKERILDMEEEDDDDDLGIDLSRLAFDEPMKRKKHKHRRKRKTPRLMTEGLEDL